MHTYTENAMACTHYEHSGSDPFELFFNNSHPKLRTQVPMLNRQFPQSVQCMFGSLLSFMGRPQLEAAPDKTRWREVRRLKMKRNKLAKRNEGANWTGMPQRMASVRKATSVKKTTAKKSSSAKTKDRAKKPAMNRNPSEGSSKPKIFSMAFGKVYPHYIAKVTKKGRSKQEVDQVICWLTGYTQKRLDELVAKSTDFEAFFSQAQLNPKRTQISGKVCGVEVSTVPDPIMREIRYLDKLIDELAQGKPLDVILRK